MSDPAGASGSAPAPATVPVPSAALPRWAPLYGARFGEAVRRFFQKYADFSGRASRSEFWWAVLFQGVVFSVIAIFMAIPGVVLAVLVASAASDDDSLGRRPDDLPDVPGAIPALIVLIVLVAVYLLVALALLVPNLAVTARRLHDAGFSAWFILLGLIPYGGLVTTVLCILPPKPSGVRFDLPTA